MLKVNNNSTKVTEKSVEVVQTIEENEKELMVTVFLPLGREAEGGNHKIDRQECVTINGKNTIIRRGEYVDVNIEVYKQLKNKYPYI